MLADIKNYWEVKDINKFVEVFKAEKEFKEITGKDIDEWDYLDSDDEIIEEILKKREGKFLLFYNENEDTFEIYEVGE